MRVAWLAFFFLAIPAVGCSVSVGTPSPEDQGGADKQHKPRITLEDVARVQGGGAGLDRPVVTLGAQDVVTGDASGEAGPAGEGTEGEEGEAVSAGEGVVLERGSVGPDDTGEGDETLGNDAADEAI